MKSINTGILQGSPLSPILFVIYVEPLYIWVDHERKFISSYVDDIQIMVSSNLWWANSKILKRAFVRMNDAATSLWLELSTDKTDLMYWPTPRERVARSEYLIEVDD